MLHTNLKFLRNSQRLTQEKWGALFGLTRGMVDSYERNAATPNPATIAKIANHYEITIDNLLEKDFLKNPTLIFASTSIEQKSPLLAAKNELIFELKEEIKFLRNQLNHITDNKTPGNE